MQHLILIIVILFSSLVSVRAQENNKNSEERTITVSVLNALNDNGTVKFALYNEEGFRIHPLFANTATIDGGISTTTFQNIPKGVYAIVCYQDENNNNTMDYYESGMPKENYGTSNNALNFGPPEFESSKFEVLNEDLTLEIKF